jgi:thymidylate synthase (FAD)
MTQIKVELQETMGSDLSIANAAWTSTYDKDKREIKYSDTDKINTLVRRLILDGHGTPIESVIFRFWIKMPIFVDRQHMTHRVASHNGLSGRYRTMPNEFYNLPEDINTILNKCGAQYVAKNYNDICVLAYEQYNSAITNLKLAEKNNLITNSDFKRAREVLRGQLPTSGLTERTTIMNLRSFANYQKQRNSDYAQPEIKKVAQLMLEEVKRANVCPIAISTLEEIGWKF